jgi:hypothetical protein
VVCIRDTGIQNTCDLQARKQAQQQQQEQMLGNKRLPSTAASAPVQERIDRVKPLWRSLDAETRRRHLTICLKDLTERAAATDEECNNDPNAQLLGVSSWLQVMRCVDMHPRRLIY